MRVVKVKGVTIGEGRPKIGISVMVKNLVELEETLIQLKQIEDEYDLIEWRMDYFDDVFKISSVNQALEKIHGYYPQKPLLVTFRTIDEGGQRPCQYVDYHNLYVQLSKNKLVDLLDAEYHFMGKNGFQLLSQLKNSHAFLLMSAHYFDYTPEYKEMLQIMFQMQKIGADIAKLAVMPNHKQDVFNVLNVTNEMVTKIAVIPIVTIAMGDLGKITRLSGELTGSAITFGSFQVASAPGQLECTNLKEIVTLLEVAEKKE